MGGAASCTRADTSTQESRISPRKQFDTRFIGSFFALDQIPKDRRPQIAVAGRSNVGKSSLLNKLLGSRKLAKVSSTPGKTRSLNFFLIDDRFYFVDLPGYGYAKVSKSIKETWGPMIEEYLTQADNLVGLLLLLDCRRDITEEDQQLVEWLTERRLPVLVVLTKADKRKRGALAAKVREIESGLGVGAIPFSIVTGEGKDALAASIIDLVDNTRVT